MTDPDKNNALTKDDLRTLRRLATNQQHALRRSSDTTADVLGAYDALIAKLDHALSAPPPDTATNGSPVTEYEVLDLIFEAIPNHVEADLYDVRDNLPRPEFYIKIRGKCWRVLAQHHPHPREQPDA